MSQSSPYPSPPYLADHMDPHLAKSILTSAWQVLEQPPPPTLREILSAYKSKGDGDRDMLLAMLNAKSAEDQRISAIATLHHKLLDARPSQPPGHDHIPPFPQPSVSAAYPPSSSSNFVHSPSLLPKISPSGSPRDVTLPSIHTSQPSPRKRARISRSPPPMRRRHSGQTFDHQPTAPSDQLPPSPPFSSPGRSTLCPELASHPPPRDAMAIGSLLSSGSHQQDTDSDWPSRTSAEREREGYRRQTKVSG